MTIGVTSREKFARQLDLVVEGGAIPARGIAALLRQPLLRWGLSPRRRVLRFVREQLEASGLAESVPADEVGLVLVRLQSMGECQEVFIGHERYVAPCPPRWIPTGEQTAVLLSVGPVPRDVVLLEAASHMDLARRIRIDDDDLAALHMAGIRRCSLDEWIRPLDYLRHARRRLGQPVRSDTLTLAAFWELLVRSLAQEGRQLGEDAEVRVLSGAPGSFFGRYDAPACEGRWSAVADGGVWCGYRRGYSDAHWHPVVVSIDGSDRRVLDLYNDDEWRWALLARGRAVGASERVDEDESSVRLTFRPPAQLSSALDLLGPSIGPWSWSKNLGVPDLWSLLW